MRYRLFRGQLKLALGALLAASLAVVSFTAATLYQPASAVAQDELDEELDPKPEEKTETKPATTGSTGGEDQSMLAFFFTALGWFYTITFLAISFVFVALIIMNGLALRRESIIPIHLVQGFENHLNEKRYQEAYDMAKNDDSFLGQVLSAGLGKLNQGYPQAIEAMQEVGEEETMKLEHRLSYIALVGSISPMVGLLGTVDGMVASFMVIARSETTPKPSELALGISTALITTLVGLWLAIPAVTIFGILRNRIQRLCLEVGVVAEQLMSRFQNVGQKKVGP
jgi:biopolymer transport protein ExbB